MTLLLSQNAYIEQIKVVDRCTHLVEPLTIKSLGIKGTNVKALESQKAIRACENSIQAHPDDPHVQFLLARAYTNGTSISTNTPIRKEIKQLIPELNDVSPQYERGYLLAKKSCSSGDLGGCTLLGYYYHKGLYQNKYRSKKTYLLWLWSCSMGTPQACQSLSGIVEKGNYVPEDLKSHYSYSLDACVSGLYPRACSYYADQNSFKRFNTDKDITLYVNYRACVAGSNNACQDLIKTLNHNMNLENQKKLYYAIKQSCKNGNTKACEEIGD